VLPNAISATLAGNLDDAGKMPQLDFCNRPTARAPTGTARFPRLDHLAVTSARVRARLTPASQLQPCF